MPWSMFSCSALLSSCTLSSVPTVASHAAAAAACREGCSRIARACCVGSVPGVQRPSYIFISTNDTGHMLVTHGRDLADLLWTDLLWTDLIPLPNAGRPRRLTGRMPGRQKSCTTKFVRWGCRFRGAIATMSLSLSEHLTYPCPRLFTHSASNSASSFSYVSPSL